jgi:hypothetical protein
VQKLEARVIVAYQPGGSVRDARVVLKPAETLPNRYNTEEAIVYREQEGGGPWLLVKPKYQVLPQDSPILSQPEIPEIETFPLTNPEDPATLFEHRDIIRMDEEEV